MLKVMIRDRDQLIHEGECASVTSVNGVGEFDILQNHANFISLISKHIIVDKGLDSEKKYNIESGVLSVERDTVEAYVE